MKKYKKVMKSKFGVFLMPVVYTLGEQQAPDLVSILQVSGNSFPDVLSSITGMWREIIGVR